MVDGGLHLLVKTKKNFWPGNPYFKLWTSNIYRDKEEDYKILLDHTLNQLIMLDHKLGNLLSKQNG